MKPIYDSDLLQLVDVTDDYLVSLYMPTRTAGNEPNQNPIRFEQLLRHAEESLVAKGMPGVDAHQYLASARELLDRPLFWETLDQGLAVLLSRSRIRVWHLPDTCEELCFVGRRYYIIPLLDWASDRHRYYVLAISPTRVRFFQGTYMVLKEVNVPGLATTVEVTLSSRHGGASTSSKPTTAERLRDIDHALAGYLERRQDPLLFAGATKLFHLYQTVNSYPHLLHRHLSKNPDLLSIADLRDQVRPMINLVTRDRQQNEIERYWRLLPQGQTMNDLSAILAAADAGRIETLFIVPTARQIGKFDPAEGSVRVDHEPLCDSEELVNLAAILVLQHGGWVEAVAPGTIPSGDPVAAILAPAK